MPLETQTGSLNVAIPLEPRLILVDCEAEVTRVIEEVFPSAQTMSLAATGTASLIKAVCENLPDVVVASGSHWSELVARLKGSSMTSMIPVVVFVEDWGDRLRAWASGADHVVAPPFDRDEIAARGVALLRSAAIARAVLGSRRELTARRDWVRYLVHDLRGLIGVALSNVSYVADSPGGEDEEARDALTDSAQELRRASALVNDLLDIERIESGRLRPRRVDTDLTALVRDVIQEMRRMAQKRGLGLILDASRPANVPIDTSLIERVVSNLMSNSIRYAPRGTSVFIDVEPLEGEVRVSVTNLGPTIPVARRAQLFQPFVRVGPDAGQGTGAGLGLAFCRLAIEAHGGTIEIGEPPGGGAIFTFTIPTEATSDPR